jgi:membrane protease YdiL (CAAX protease family)
MYLLMALILAGPMTPPGTPTLLALAAIAVCVGFGEELMFRGLVFHWFRDRTVRAQILISSLAFGGAHLIALLHVDAPAVILSQAFFASAVGAVFASAWARDRSIWIPIMVHSLFDFVALAASGSIGEALADTPETVVRLLVGGAVIWLWGGYLVWRAPRWQQAHLAVTPPHVGDDRF